MAKTLKLKKISRPPRIVRVGPKASQPNLVKIILVALLVILAVFTIFYLFKINSPAFKQHYREKFEEQTQDLKLYNVMYVYSANCGHCTKFSPIFDDVERSATSLFPDTLVTFSKAESEDAAAQPYLSSITGFPSIFIELNGEIQGEPITGGLEKQAFIDAIRAVIS